MSDSAESRLIFGPLFRKLNRPAFSSGVASLDTYLHRQAMQDVDRDATAAFVLFDPTDGTIAGYYTLGAYVLDPGELPEDVARRLPDYPLLPAVLIGRLAVDTRFQGQGLGALLLYDALRQALEHSPVIAAVAVVVDALDDSARAFYERHDFIPFPSNPLKLYLPMKTIRQMQRSQQR
ncbi:MAG TPA: GNAT family N-acetyltransferase [Thermomicrobiales bacterium]|nr:GNAT family N-acetyltransferase [Thermomicrobiales bacterium]